MSGYNPGIDDGPQDHAYAVAKAVNKPYDPSDPLQYAERMRDRELAEERPITTHEVEKSYVYHYGRSFAGVRKAAFDLWLENHEREVIMAAFETLREHAVYYEDKVDGSDVAAVSEKDIVWQITALKEGR